MTGTKLPPRRPRSTEADLALDAIRIVDFTHFVAGPFCTLILGDFGADVIKVENPKHGDDFRLAAAPEGGGDGYAFIWANRNKRSITLDLACEAGRDTARRLIASADVVVENFSAGVMERLGLGYDAVSPDNPGLIYCSISAYGREGPFAHRFGFDPILQAESGLMSINGAPDGPAIAIGTPVVDITSGMMASNAILAALFARSRTGRGQHIEIALFDQAVTMLGYAATGYLLTGEAPQRTGNSTRTTVPVGVFSAQDGEMFICCANERTYRRLALDVLQRPDLADDPRFATNAARSANYDTLMPLLAGLFRSDSRAVWLRKMRDAGVPVGPVATVDEALASDEVRERGLLSEIPHPQAGTVPNVELPFRMSGTPVANPRAAPTLGQHSREVLREVLGFSDTEIASLQTAGAFGTREPV